MTSHAPLPLAIITIIVFVPTGCHTTSSTAPTLGPAGTGPASSTTAASSATFTATGGYAVDGDTLAVTIDGQDERVRLLGIDTPETGDCGADTARSRLQELVDAQQLTITTDPVADQIDRYGRILAYISAADHEDVALTLIQEGLAEAWWPDGEPTPGRGDAYQTAAGQAQTDQVGSWAVCGTIGR